MYDIIATNQFSKYYKQCIKRKYSIHLLDEIIIQLAETGSVPLNYKPHILSGKLHGYWECHVKPDWLLIWIKKKIKKPLHLLVPELIPTCFKYSPL